MEHSAISSSQRGSSQFRIGHCVCLLHFPCGRPPVACVSAEIAYYAAYVLLVAMTSGQRPIDARNVAPSHSILVALPYEGSYNVFMSSVIKIDPQIQGGTPCFAGTRVPVRSLFDYIERGRSVDYFLEQFPSVTREQVTEIIHEARKSVLQEPSPPRSHVA
jgi:uncharacterized protein (DUF433 family)